MPCDEVTLERRVHFIDASLRHGSLDGSEEIPAARPAICFSGSHPLNHDAENCGAWWGML
jgi:hypothetical protein